MQCNGARFGGCSLTYTAEGRAQLLHSTHTPRMSVIRKVLPFPWFRKDEFLIFLVFCLCHFRLWPRARASGMVVSGACRQRLVSGYSASASLQNVSVPHSGIPCECDGCLFNIHAHIYIHTRWPDTAIGPDHTKFLQKAGAPNAPTHGARACTHINSLLAFCCWFFFF